MKPRPHTTITFVSSGEAPGHVTRGVLVNGTPVTVAEDGVEVSQPANNDVQRVTITLLPDEIHFTGPDEDAPASTETARNGDLSDEDADQAPTDTPDPERAADRMRADNLEAFKHEAETPMREHGDCCDDPDEALARVICQASGDSWIVNGDDYLPAARAAREHIQDDLPNYSLYVAERERAEKAEAERDEWEAAYRRVDGAYSRARNERDMWQVKFEQTDNLLSRTRDERDKAEVERLTRERDEARREARMHENAADDLRAHRDRHKADARAATKRARDAEGRYKALRADVDEFQYKHREYPGTWELVDALARDDERGEQS